MVILHRARMALRTRWSATGPLVDAVVVAIRQSAAAVAF